MSVHELQPIIQLGFLRVGQRVGREIKPNLGLGSSHFNIDEPEDEEMTSWRGYLFTVIDEDTVSVVEIGRVKVHKDKISSLMEVSLRDEFRLLRQDKINKDQVTRGSIRWINKKS